MGKKPDRMLRDCIPSPLPMISQIYKPRIEPGRNVLDCMSLDIEDSGVFLGLETVWGKGYYVGKCAEDDGNIMITGINGAGKSHVLVKSSLRTWRDIIVALDIKGELSNGYMCLKRKGIVKRACVIFDPTNGGTHYDVYAPLEKSDPHFVQYVREISYAIIPMPLDVREPYWINMARDFLSGAIIYYFERGYDFIDTILLVQQTSVSNLCDEIMASNCTLAKMLVSEISALKAEHKAAIGTDVKQHTMIFATDADIQYALSKNEDGFGSFSWGDIVMNEDAPNVFLCLDQSRLEQWSGVIRLMVTQLIRQIERRPDKHSPHGAETKPILMLLDEFPQLGRMDIITEAMTTLRSKKVTLDIVIQSIAQLDAVYGSAVRKILVDNCQYKAILQVTEPGTQEYLSKMIGTVPTPRVGVSQSYSPHAGQPTWGTQIQEIREPLIHPHEFATNNDIWLHTPYGFLSTIKLPATVTDLHANDFDKAIDEYFRRNRNENGY